MPRHRRMYVLLLGAVSSGLACPPGAIAGDSRFAVGDTVVAEYPAPQLAVGARGDAVVAWVASGYIRGEKPGGDTAPMVFAALRRAGRGFSRARRVSEPTRGMRTFAAAMGPAGDAAIVWEPDAVRSADLRVSRGRASGRLAAPHAIPGSGGALAPVAAIDAHGRLLVAWLRSGRDRCGSFVMASVARRGERFGRPRRVSERCAHATLVRVALARDGDGVVAWRSEGAHAVSSNSRVRVSAYAGRRLGAPRTVSTVPRVGPTLAVAAGSHRALVVWRDAGPLGGRVRGRVLAVAVSGSRVGKPVAVQATRARVIGDVAVAMNARGAALVGWAQTPKLTFEPEVSGHVASQSRAGRRFGAPVRLSRNIDDAGVGVALDGVGRGIAGYAGDRLRRMGRGGAWGAALALDPPRPEDDENDFPPEPERLRVGMSDAGEAVAMWLSSTDDSDGIRVRVLRAPRRR